MSDRSDTYFFDNESTAQYFSQFLTAKEAIPEYQTLLQHAEKDERSASVLLPVQKYLDNDQNCRTNILFMSCSSYEENRSKSVYTNLRNCISVLPKREWRHAFLQSEQRLPEDNESDDRIIISDMGTDYESFDYAHGFFGSESVGVLSPEERGYWMTVFDRISLEDLRKLIEELTRLANSVSIAKLNSVPTTLAEVDDFIRAEREARQRR